MQQQTSLHIATPCHENWDAMTPAEAGKFCASCYKPVVDFTLMSDKQILQFLAGHGGGVCGRFDAGQLSRPLVEPTVHKKRSWWLALVLPLSLFFQKSWGQSGKRTVGKLAVKVEQKPTMCDIVMGTLARIVPDRVTLQGTLRDETGRAVENASVVVKGTKYSCVSDSAGRFLIQLPRETDSVVVMASSIGYQPVERKVSVEETDTAINMILPIAEAMLDSVVVTSYNDVSCRSMMGAVSTVERVTYAEKRDTLVRKLLRLTPFTLYPNPARSGSRVEIRFQKAGRYELQLLSNASALLKTEEVQVNNDTETAAFQLPSNLAVGVYYLRLISADRKCSYLEKILVN